MPEKIPTLEYFPISQFSELTEGGTYTVHKDKYWIVTPDNCIIRFKSSSWQCNSNKTIAEMFLKQYPGCTVQQIPFIYIPFFT